MGLFDRLFGTEPWQADQNTQASGQALSPQTQTPLVPDFNTFRDNYVNAAGAQEKATGNGNFWSWISGSGQDAATAAAKMNAPAAYFKMMNDQAGATSAQLGLLPSIAAASAIAGRPVDPNNVLGSAGAVGAYGAGMSDQPQPAQPAPSGPAPGLFPRLATAAGNTMGAGLPPSMTAPQNPQNAPGPQGQPAPMPSPSVSTGGTPAPMPFQSPSLSRPAQMPNGQPSQMPDPQQTQRAGMYRMGRIMLMNPQTAAAGEDMIKQATADRPAGSSFLPDGSYTPTVLGNGQTSQAFEARGAGMKSTAEAEGGVHAANAINDHSTANTIAAHAANAGIDAAHTLTSVRGTDGFMHQVPVASVLNGAAGGNSAVTGFADPETHTAQIKEITDAQTAGSEAAAQQNTVQMLGKSLASSAYTGTGGATGLSILKAADGLGLLSPEMQQKVAQGEFSKMGAVEVSGILAKQISGGRTPLGIFNQVAASKPSIVTAHPELMIQALSQDLQRAQDKAAFTTQYYSQPGNNTKLDAQTAFDKAYPIGMYQSRVLPLSLPNKGTVPQTGYTYTLPNRGAAVWDGREFQPAGQ